MGRIDEALRQSSKNGVFDPKTGGHVQEGDLFVAPWVFREPTLDAAAVVPAARESHRSAERAVEVPRIDRSGGLPATGVEFHRTRGFSEAWIERLVIAPVPDPLLVEQFRQLAGKLIRSQVEHGTRVVMVTSAGAGEGKSLSIVNLALTLSGSYRQRVLLVDADLRRPSLHKAADVPGTKGLGDTLKSSVDQKLPVYELTDKLMLVPAGQPDSDPMRALTSPRMEQLLAEAATRFDWVLVDSPPIGPIVDTALLLPNIDAAIMVVRAGKANISDVKRAIESLGRERVLGVLLNCAEEVEHGEYRRYYQAYGVEDEVR